MSDSAISSLAGGFDVPNLKQRTFRLQLHEIPTNGQAGKFTNLLI